MNAMITVHSREILAALSEHAKHADCLLLRWEEGGPNIDCTECETEVVRFRLPGTRR